jgi:hypothetical protein
VAGEVYLKGLLSEMDIRIPSGKRDLAWGAFVQHQQQQQQQRALVVGGTGGNLGPGVADDGP